MAEAMIKLEVVTPQKLVVSTEVSEVSAPSVNGEFGVLPGHRALLAALEHGRVSYVEGGKRKDAAIGPGFAEVGSDQVMLLVERWVAAEAIDQDEARDELARAELRLRELESKEPGAEHELARRAEKWATVRLEVARAHRQI